MKNSQTVMPKLQIPLDFIIFCPLIGFESFNQELRAAPHIHVFSVSCLMAPALSVHLKHLYNHESTCRMEYSIIV